MPAFRAGDSGSNPDRSTGIVGYKSPLLTPFSYSFNRFSSPAPYQISSRLSHFIFSIYSFLYKKYLNNNQMTYLHVYDKKD
jgi:hypothetical protein